MIKREPEVPNDGNAKKAQALVPYPLSTETQERNRARIVRGFKEWIFADHDRADEELSLRALSEIGIGSRNTLGAYFKAEECAGSPWMALCYMAMEDYLPGTDPEPPDTLRKNHSRYQLWRANTRRDNDDLELSELKLTDSDQLLKIIEAATTPSDLLTVTTAARIYTKRLHSKLISNSLLTVGGSALQREEAIENAGQICEVAERVIDDLVWPRRAELSPQVQRNCAAIIDSTVDARRLLSRVAERQFPELALLLALRYKDSDLTKAVRTEAGRAMVQYNIDHTEALMARSAISAAEGEIQATENLLNTLTGIRAFGLRDDVLHLSASGPPANALPSAKLMAIAARLAMYIIAYASPTTESSVSAREKQRRIDFAVRTKKCAQQLLSVLDPDLDPSVRQDRADVISLLGAAREHRFIVGPSTALRILRFRGTGEMLVARMLTNIATTEPPIADRYVATLYLHKASASLSGAAVHQTLMDSEERRTILMERARTLYQRAIEWQRNAGASKRLKALATTELEQLQKLFDERATSVAPDQGNRSAPSTLEGAVTRLRSDLDQMIVEGILWADLRELNKLPDESRLRVQRLLNTLSEATRFLKDPEMGLRTDLPPRQ
ncbi:hypothetical protein ACXPWS_29215 [Mycobacterium sp. BMJ-28]